MGGCVFFALKPGTALTVLPHVMEGSCFVPDSSIGVWFTELEVISKTNETRIAVLLGPHCIRLRSTRHVAFLFRPLSTVRIGRPAFRDSRCSHNVRSMHRHPDPDISVLVVLCCICCDRLLVTYVLYFFLAPSQYLTGRSRFPERS
jgi:hypothetical protein